MSAIKQRGIRDRPVAYLQRRSMRLILLTVLLLLCGDAVGAAAAPPPSADAVAQRFFEAVRRHDYRKAYGLLSLGVQRDLPYYAFERRSRDIRSFQVVEMKRVEQGAHLIRYRVKGRLRMVYQGDLFDAVYAGTADMSKNGDDWRIAQVDLKPIEQKRLGKAPPEYHL